MQYDVFISCKSEDYKYAEEIYEFLEANGIHTFLASKELRTLGESEYRRAISAAMKSTYHMIVFASNAEYVDSTWVYYEWDMFINAKLKGYKSGQIVTILKDVNVDDINMDLWKYESFMFDNYKEKLLSYAETPSSLKRREEVRKKQEELEHAKRKQEEQLKKQQEVKELLITLAKEYRRKVADLNSIDAKEIVVNLRSSGISAHVCPVCTTEVDVAKSYCPTCGWTISPIDNIEGAEYLSLVNEKQLKVVKEIYCKYAKLEDEFRQTADISKEKETLEAKVSELTTQVKELQEKILEMVHEHEEIVRAKNELERSNNSLVSEISAMKEADKNVQNENTAECTYDLFLCYSRQDISKVRLVHQHLSNAGYKCWFDLDEMRDGMIFEKAMSVALKSSRCVLYFHSKFSNQSTWVQKEIHYALENQMKVLSIELDDSPYTQHLALLAYQSCKLEVFDNDSLQTLEDTIRNLFCHKDSIRTNVSELQTKDSKKKTYTVNGVSFTMIEIEGGTFMMGATSEQGSSAGSNEKPVHRVTLSNYSIGETEVTQALWQVVMDENPSHFTGDLQRPVEQVSWNDCQTFIKKLNELTGENFRLPTEAEWEYAARGGKESKSNKYSGSNTIGDVAWSDSNSSSKTYPVKTKQSNELGIYDMSGNVWEWCSDWYGDYSFSAQTNPSGPSSGSFRVFRGGSWCSVAEYCRVTCRDCHSPDRRDNNIGFRLAR